MPRSPATRPRRPYSPPPGRRRRPDPDGIRLGRRQGRFGQDRGRQVARPGPGRNRCQAQRRQAQGRDRGHRRQGPECDRRRQQLHRSGRGGQADGHDHAADHRRRDLADRPDFQAAGGARARAEDRFRDRAERPARNRHASRRRGLCDGFARRRWSRPRPRRSRIRDQVANDWINSQATDAPGRRGQIEAEGRAGLPLAEAVKESGAPLPPVQPDRRAPDPDRRWRKDTIPPALKILFTLGEGKSRMSPDPQGRGFFVVKVNKITPGNALIQPGLIGRMQNELARTASQDYARGVLRRACAAR